MGQLPGVISSFWYVEAFEESRTASCETMIAKKMNSGDAFGNLAAGKSVRNN